MAINLPADLPTDFAWDETIAPNGSDIGQPAQRGYNYLTAQVNAAQTACNELDAMIAPILAPEMHRMIFRGENLGTTVSTAQKTAIQNGSFDNLYVGDYWTINGMNWRIADINYYLNCGDTAFTTPHLVIVPDQALYRDVMNLADVTTGAYIGSRMYTANLDQAKTMATNAFGNMVKTHRSYFSNAVTNGYPSAGAWFDSTVELMNEINVYGGFIFSSPGGSDLRSSRYTLDNTQFALFAMVPKSIKTRYNYWLRNVVSDTAFAAVSAYGNAVYDVASALVGVRPSLCIG